jgi:outer membrane protein assembly factor BamB
MNVRFGWLRHRTTALALPLAVALVLLTAVEPGSAAAARSGRNVHAGALGQLYTYDYNNARNGVDTADPSLATIHKAWSDGSNVISGGIHGQPLVDGNLVIVATEADEVYALNASTGKVAWKFSIGAPAHLSVVDSAPGLSGCGNIDPLGITSTPVIDPKTSEVFVAGEVQESHTTSWHGVEHVLVGARFTSSKATILWDHEIDPPGSGTTYIIPAEQQRSGLTLANGRVYAEFGGLAGDCGSYQGYVVSEPETGVKSFESFKVPTTREGAIWASGGAATSSSGELFVATGNSADGPGARFDYGDAVIGLSPTLKMEGYFAPRDWAQRNVTDRDLGSGSPVILPGGSLVFEIGKAGANGVSSGFLLDAAKLGGIGHDLFNRAVCPNGGFVFGASAVAVIKVSGANVTYVYVPCPTGTVAIQVHGGATPNFSVRWQASSGHPNGSPILAGGLVWALCTGADGGSGPPVLYGMNPATGKVEVTESVPSLEHFATPAAGDGMVFVASASGVEAFKP